MSARSVARGDRGFSLVELSVYIVVLGILSTVVAATMISLFRSEQTVSDITGASNDTQVVVAALTSDIKNARRFETTPHRVIASVAGSDPAADNVWQCVRWEIDGGAGTLALSTKPDATGSDWSSPTIMASGVTQLSEPNLFVGSGTATATGTLNYSFGVTTTGSGSIDMTGQISNRVPGGAGSTCF